MNGMTVYDIVRIERQVLLDRANRLHQLDRDLESRRRLWRRPPER